MSLYTNHPEIPKAEITRLTKRETTPQEEARGQALVGGFAALKSVLIQADVAVKPEDNVDLILRPDHYGIITPSTWVDRFLLSQSLEGEGSRKPEAPEDMEEIIEYSRTRRPFLIASLGFTGLEDYETLWHEPDDRNALGGQAASPYWIGRRDGVEKRLAYGYKFDWSAGHQLAIIREHIKKIK